MDPDAQDILGQPTLPVMDVGDKNSKSFSVLKFVLTLITLAGGWVAYMWIRQEVLLWREKSFKLATRRRHGIPDDDRRPFNVAYAAAMLAKEEREKNGRSKPLRPPPTRPPVQDQSAPQLDHTIRNRTDRYRSATAMPFPGAYTSASSLGPSHDTPQQPQTNAQPSGSRHAARRIVDLSSEVQQEQRGVVDSEPEVDDGARSSSQVGDDDEVMADGDDIPEEAGWEDYDAALSHQRPQKRGLGDSGNQERKRARKVSSLPEEMEVDEERDELGDLLSPVRGKKRDRAEAGSTFGGDDDDSADEDGKLRRRRRKRRTEGKKKSEAGTSRKRDRDMDVDDEDLDSTGEPGGSKRKRKRGKRHSRADVERDDISVDGSLASTASKSRRSRTVGEEWESNGVKYKLGPDGQRLQQVLVKRARNKFVMPKDSEHPDKDENLEVFVETWLTEEEYQKAKEEKLLAWQDSPRKPEPEPLTLKIPNNTKPSGAVGKKLLWPSSAVTPGASPASASSLDSPALRGSGLRAAGRARYSLGVNPFEKQPDISTKRIVSTAIMNQSLATSTTPSGSPGLTDTTNTREPRPRTLSKWERQELEAEAIMRLRHARQAEIDAAAREKAEKEQREKELKERLEREKQERERAEKERQEKQKAEMERQERERKEKAAQAAVTVPKITVTTPSTDGIKPPAAPGGFSFSAPTAPAATATTAKPVGAPTFFAPTTGAAPAASSTSTAAPTTTPFGAPKTDSSAPAAAKGGFSFAAPSAPAANPAAGGFSFGAPKPAEEKKTETKSMFAFPSSSTTAAAPSAFGNTGAAPSTANAGAAGAAAKPKFDFFSGAKPAEAAGAGSSTDNKTAAPAGGNPLFSFKPAATASSTTAAPAASGTAAAPSKFSFGVTPTTANGTTTSAFGVPAATNGTTGSVFGAPAATNGTTGFGAPVAANGTATSAFSAPATTGTTGSVFGSTNKPATSVFGQPSGSGASSSNTTAGSSSALAGALGSNTGATSAFGFGNADKGKASAFGTFSAPTTNSSTSADKGKAPAFGGFGTTGTSAFGSTAKPGESVFGATSKPGENAAAGSSTTSQPKFSFGGASTTPPTGASSSFGTFGGSNGTTTTPAGAPAASGSGFSFNFNKPATSAGAPGAVAPSFSFGAPAGSAFGATTTPAGKPPVFSFGKK